jgi:hypothetical protein
MNTHLRFYKKNDNWYADVPSHEEADNIMVEGSDILLDKVSRGKSEVKLCFTDNPQMTDFVLIQTHHDEFGADYVVFGSNHGDNLSKMKCWICNVTHTVLGEHPEIIMIHNETDL